MSPTTTIPPTHVPCAREWPALSPSRIATHEVDDWEFVPELAETSFERDSVRIAEPIRNETEVGAMPPICLKHAQSTPNFRTVLEGSDNDDAVLIGNKSQAETEDGVASVASWSMVSGPPSVASAQSSWSNGSKMSFRDAIMKETIEETCDDSGVNESEEQATAQPSKALKKKPKFVVKPIKRCAKSMADLRSLARIAENGGGDEDSYTTDLVLGETDAELFYSQKMQGKIGRKNGQKTRPDEAKRLQITMAKKEDQRQRQKAAALNKC